MAISQQDLFVYLLLGDNGYCVDEGAGNGSGAPCASNFSWLEDKHGWKGLLLDYDCNLIKEAQGFRKNATSVCVDLLKVNFKELFYYYKVPKVIDYLTIDIDPIWNGIQDPNVELLRRFPFEHYDFKILTVEHDLYNPHGQYQRQRLNEFMKDKKYKLIVEDVGCAHETKNYLENWYINPKYYSEFKIKDIENLYYYRMNPNDIICDLFGRRK